MSDSRLMDSVCHPETRAMLILGSRDVRKYLTIDDCEAWMLSTMSVIASERPRFGRQTRDGIES